MFGKFNNNNAGISVNVNTRLYTSYSDESLLVLSAWNTNLSVKFQPTVGKNADGITQYSNETASQITASITPETLELINKAVNDVILPAYDKKESASVAVLTGASQAKRKILDFVTDGEFISVNVIFGGTINLDGTSSDTTMLAHKFNNRSIITNYSKDSGGSTISVPTDFLAFISKLNELSNIDGSTSHGINYNNAIKSAYAAHTNGGGNSAPASQNTYAAPVTNVGDGDIDEFLPFT